MFMFQSCDVHSIMKGDIMFWDNAVMATGHVYREYYSYGFLLTSGVISSSCKTSVAIYESKSRHRRWDSAVIIVTTPRAERFGF